ncbi:MAG: hypothetical protein KDK25_12480 [Leptospiraceae bacterium]|nr:hypothetical protein [Leptospiraceae bacterium]
MIFGILALLIALGALVFMLLPVMQPVQDGAHYFISGKTRKQDLIDEKSRILANLQDLRIEAESGKIPDNELKKLSAPLLRSLDRIEADLAKHTDTERVHRDPRFCPECGHRRNENESICIQCGSRIGSAEPSALPENGADASGARQ